MTKSEFIALSAMLLAAPYAAFAQVNITEVMYDLPVGSDTGREWVELFNLGATPVNISSLRLFENGTNHKITPVPGGADFIAPGAYAVVAASPEKFKVDHPQYSVSLFDSSFDLSNTGETIVLRSASSTDLDTFTYASSMGGRNGNTLNRAPSGGSIVSRASSPGSAMEGAEIPPPAPKIASAKKTATSGAKKTAAAPQNAAAEPQPAGEDTDLEDVHDVNVLSQVASVTPTQHSAGVFWWVAAAALTLIAAGAVFVARQSGKKEWIIFEDSAG